MTNATKHAPRSCVTVVIPDNPARAQAIVVDFDSLLDGVTKLPDPEGGHLAAYDPVRALISLALGEDSTLPLFKALAQLPEDAFQRARELMPDSWRDPDSESSKTPEQTARRLTWDHSLDPYFTTHLRTLLDDIPPTASPNVEDPS